jgi:hypothetical protein
MAYRMSTSQVQSKVEQKPNIASLPKLRCSSGQQAGPGDRKDTLTRTTCCRLSMCISRRSISVPVHLASSIVRELIKGWGARSDGNET